MEGLNCFGNGVINNFLITVERQHDKIKFQINIKHIYA